MELYKLMALLSIISTSSSQHRMFSWRRQNHRRNNMRHFHRNERFPHFKFNEIQQFEQEQINDISTFCPQIEISSLNYNQWQGKFIYEFGQEGRGVDVELEFKQHVIGFINDFGHSTSMDNRIFIIKDASKNYTCGEKVQFNFIVNYNVMQEFPDIAKIKVNNELICPEKVEDTKCVKLELLDRDRESWKGMLTIYANLYNIGSRIDFIFDESVIAFINHLGDSTTVDQRHFTMLRFNKNAAQQIVINFMVKFDQFKKPPMLTEIYIDGISACMFNKGDFNIFSTTHSPFLKEATSLNLDSLPFHIFPNITIVPKIVQNDGFECGTSGSLNFRVDNGEQAVPGQFPFHAAMFYNKIYRCAASLITEKALLTAAHCVVDSAKEVLPPQNFQLLFGSVDLESLTGNENLRNVSKIVKHPAYSHDKILKQDIAVMILKGSVQFSNYIKPICMSQLLPSIIKRIDKEMIVLGFGSSYKSVEPSRFLNYGKMTVISRDECTNNLIFALLPEDSTFCAKSKENSLCPGDSGGAILESINGKYFLRGIASVTVTKADGRCNVDNPVGFTDLYSFNRWIKENIE